MRQRIFLVHGWDGNQENAWFPWLQNKLRAKGFDVVIPAMPNPEEPEIGAWVAHLRGIVGTPDKNDIFVGHSIGCQTILRYLASLPEGTKVKGAVFVAPWLHLPHIAEEGEEIFAVARPWLETSIDFGKVRAVAGKIITILSDNDPHGPIEDKSLFETNLSAETIVEHARGHLGGDAGLFELSSVLAAVMKIAG